MKFIFGSFFLIIFSLLNSLSNPKFNTNNLSKQSKKITISGKVLQTFNYCGGAKPIQAVLDNLAKPKAYPNKTFYIIKGDLNTINSILIDSFVTQKDGSFSSKLAPGIYSIIVEEQLKPIDANKYQTKNQKVNEQCLKDWWKKPYYILNVKRTNISNLNFTINHRCFLSIDIPCISYIGPYPH